MLVVDFFKLSRTAIEEAYKIVTLHTNLWTNSLQVLHTYYETTIKVSHFNAYLT